MEYVKIKRLSFLSLCKIVFVGYLFSVVPVFAVYLLFTMDMKNIFTDILGTIIMMALIVFAAPLQTAFFIWFGHLISSKFMIFGIEYQKGTES
ncbi:MAG: hypothetical protein KDI46_08195 [Alphaproteobacteria bacterium]|nr:hypothetical protein [Alphaproteobacteria bacterium]